MYKPQIETASRKVIEDIQLRLFQSQLRYVYEHSLLYRPKYDEVGLDPRDIKTLEDVRKLPVSTFQALHSSLKCLIPPSGELQPHAFDL